MSSQRIAPDLEERMLRADPAIARRIATFRATLATVGTRDLIAAQLAVIDETTARCDAIEDLVHHLRISSESVAEALDDMRREDRALAAPVADERKDRGL